MTELIAVGVVVAVAVFEIVRLSRDVSAKSNRVDSLVDKIAEFHVKLVDIENQQQTRYFAMLEQASTRLADSFEVVIRSAMETIVRTEAQLHPAPPQASVGISELAMPGPDEMMDMISQVQADPREMDRIMDEYLAKMDDEA